MLRQTIEFAVKQTNNIVSEIERSYITHPETHFSGDSIKWYKDKPRQQNSNKNG